MTTEIWKDIPGFEGRYQASSEGRVRSVDRAVRIVTRWGVETTRNARGKVLRPAASASGHLMVMLGRRGNRSVHVLVMLAFEGPPPPGHEVLHLNHQPDDNRRVNLRYGTRSENIKMDYAAGARKVHPNFNRWGHRYG
jgi:hypothetical protein